MKISFERACELYDEICNDCEETVIVMGYEFSPADVLKEMDPIAYRCEVFQYTQESGDEIVINLSRSEKIKLIVELMVNQGIEDAEEFESFISNMAIFNDSELDAQLSILEENVLL
jgi:hypothetical protein